MTQLSIYNPQLDEDIVRLELELTSTCNLKCPLCIRHVIPTDNDGERFRPLQDVITQLNGYPNLQYITIAGAISEPTLYPDLPGLIKYLKQRDIEVSLYLNGDTRDDMYYRKLGVLFRECKGHVYFTICGSTQEMHEKYRVNSKLSRVLERLDLVNKFSGNKGILTWIIFNYNEYDFMENYEKYKNKYNTEFFYTLPMNEHFKLHNNIHLPKELRNVYFKKIDRNDFKNVKCQAVENNFVQITHDGKVTPCSLYRYHGESHCFECSTKNLAMLRKHKIFNIAEPESETSEKPMRIFYD